jgi:Tfp pilus assembly protein PilN
MFTIDLLKGQAIPLKGKPGSLAIIVISIAIPVTVAAGILSFYQRNKIVVSVKEQEIAKCQAEIEKLSDAIELKRALEKKKTDYSSCLSEVKSSIKRYTQWSPVLTTIMENIPESVTLSSLSVEHNSVKKKVPKEDNPQKMVEVDVLVRTLRLSVVGNNQDNNDEAVRDFRDRLRDSEFLGPRLENIGVSQKSETRNGRDIVSYEISCVLKAGS